MKYLLVLVVVLVAVWVWRHNRETEVKAAPRPSPPRPPTRPDQMVACQHCGVHLPRTEAMPGTRGYYCGQEHQRLGER